jgi:hypothetical protein
MFPVLPFVAGVVAAPLVKGIVKPLVLGIVTTSVGVGLELKRAVLRTGEGLQDLAAEASADRFAAEVKGTEPVGTTKIPVGTA